ncbi:MAG: hypothetical protein H6735_25440 [Alphaproteobacteria bacterium]|nr:hypothetical protein [Alphaproteobacteria bacterium]
MSVVTMLALVGCGQSSAPTAMEAAPAVVDMPVGGLMADEGGAMMKEEAEMARPAAAAAKGAGRRDRQMASNEAPAAEPEPMDDADKDQAAQGGEDGSSERTRSWFPESFLWRPLVETGDDGVAELDVTVPDQLTTWRVLALAADASGQQSGTVHTFDSTLPVYVDPVVPGWLYAGDRIDLPVQAVNTTDHAISARLSLQAQGALGGEGVATIALSPGGSDVRSLPLRADGAGEATILAKLSAGSDSDAAERSFPVLPTGRPVERHRGGTLTDDRTFSLAGPGKADPSTEQIEVVVFAGPLAVVQAEVARVNAGARPDDGAYGFALASFVDELSAASGVEVDDKLNRRLQILAWQRVVRDLRAPDANVAADLLGSMRDVSGHEQAEGALPILVSAVTRGQRADGAWARRDRSTLQEILVNTAFVGRTLGEEQQGSRLRASAFLERFLHEVKDPYTAAVLLASGLLDGDAEEPLRKLLDEALVDDADGVPTVNVPADVVDMWGVRPSASEMLAWTVLALPDDHEDRGDLAARLMQRWDARWGFGAGRADTLALEAVVSALPGAPDAVDLTLTVGDAVARGRLDPSQPKLPVLLTVRPGTGAEEVVLKASPAVPGLAFVATRRSWVPWTDEDRLRGVEAEVSADRLTVGEEGHLHLTLSAPSGTSLHVEQGLPAGVVVDPQLAQRYPRLSGVRVLQDRLMFDTASFGAGEILEIDVPVTPAFSGTFSTAPLLVGTRGSEPVPMAPMAWTIGS